MDPGIVIFQPTRSPIAADLGQWYVC